MSTTFSSTMHDCARELFGFDWTAFYERHGLTIGTDLITSSVWLVTGGSKGNEFIDGADTDVFLFGGTVGTALTAKNTIQINNGTFIDCETLILTIS